MQPCKVWLAHWRHPLCQLKQRLSASTPSPYNTPPQVCPQETTPAGLEGLTSLGLLHNLEHLALYDAELPCEALGQHLAAATRLSSLQFGLSSVSTELSALKGLPKIQVSVG